MNFNEMVLKECSDVVKDIKDYIDKREYGKLNDFLKSLNVRSLSTLTAVVYCRYTYSVRDQLDYWETFVRRCYYAFIWRKLKIIDNIAIRLFPSQLNAHCGGPIVEFDEFFKVIANPNDPFISRTFGHVSITRSEEYAQAYRLDRISRNELVGKLKFFPKAKN